MLSWLREHPGVLVWAGASIAAGIVLLVISLAVVVRLPPDYLQRERRKSERPGPRTNRPAWRSIARNILAWVLIAAGAAMVVFPGPGLPVLLVGVVLADFPGKSGVLRWIITRARVLDAINRLRKRFGQPPLEVKPSAA